MRNDILKWQPPLFLPGRHFSMDSSVRQKTTESPGCQGSFDRSAGVHEAPCLRQGQGCFGVGREGKFQPCEGVPRQPVLDEFSDCRLVDNVTRRRSIYAYSAAKPLYEETLMFKTRSACRQGCRAGGGHHSILGNQSCLREVARIRQGQRALCLLRRAAHRKRETRRAPRSGPRVQGYGPEVQGGYGLFRPRKGGWDCQGLPVEIEVEKRLHISGKQQIEEYGVEAFVRECKSSVFTYKAEWEKMTSRIGFWLDTEHAYATYTTITSNRSGIF